MRQPLFLLIALVALLGPARITRAADEITVELAWGSVDSWRYASREIELGDKPPAGTKALKGSDLLYGSAPFGPGRELLVAVDVGTPSRLWVDQDFDEQLKDEEPFVFPRAKNARSTTAVVHLPISLEGEPDDLMLRLDFALVWKAQRKFEDAPERLQMTLRAHREGSVLLAGREREVVLKHRAADLRFDAAETAMLYVDLDGDGVLKPADEVEIGKPFRLRDRGYVAQPVGFTGRQVTFRPIDVVPPRRAAPWQPHSVPPSGRRDALVPGAFEKAKADYEFAAEQQAEGKRVRLSRYVEKIGQAGTPEAFKYLQRIYRSSQSPSYLKVAAVAAMSNGHYVEFAPKVARLVRRARDPIVTIAAVRALHAMGDPERESTYAYLLRRTKEASAFRVVAEHLAYLQGETAMQVLDDALAKETRGDRLEALYHAAMHFGQEPPSRERMLALVASEKERLRKMALEDARRFGIPDLPALAMTAARGGVEDPALRSLLIEILGRRADAVALAVLLPLLPDASPMAGQRLAALLTTLRDPAAAEVLVAQLDNAHPRVRIIVADALARIPGDRIRAAIRARIKPERDPAVLAAVMRAAGRYRDEQAGPLIVAAARRMPREGAVQAAAIQSLARIGFEPPCVGEFFTERLGRTEGELRLEIIEAAVASGHPGAGPVLARLLAEPEWDTRFVVARGLGRLRVKSALPALIAVLEDERNTRVRRAVGHTLFVTTGQYLGDDHATWQRWWSDHGTSFEVPAAIPRLPKQEDRPYATTFYGVPVETRAARVVFVIDKSGSMSEGAQLSRAKDETLKVIAKLDDKSRANVIFFEGVISTWSRKLEPLSRSTRRDLRKYMRTQQPQGGTNLWGGLGMALDTRGVETIYILSDGRPNIGSLRDGHAILEAVRRINRKRRIVIHGVSLGRHSELLKNLAEGNGGIYTRI